MVKEGELKGKSKYGSEQLSKNSELFMRGLDKYKEGGFGLVSSIEEDGE